MVTSVLSTIKFTEHTAWSRSILAAKREPRDYNVRTPARSAAVVAARGSELDGVPLLLPQGVGTPHQ